MRKFFLDTIGNRVRHVRETMGLKQGQMAVKLGIPQSSLSQFESDKRIPGIEILIKISQLANVSTDWLLLGENSEGEPVKNNETKPERVAEAENRYETTGEMGRKMERIYEELRELGRRIARIEERLLETELAQRRPSMKQKDAEGGER